MVSGKIKKNKKFGDEYQVIVDNIDSFDSYFRSIEVTLNAKHQELFSQLSDVLHEHRGECPVKFLYQYDNLEGQLSLPQSYFVSPKRQLSEALNDLLGNQVSEIRSC